MLLIHLYTDQAELSTCLGLLFFGTDPNILALLLKGSFLTKGIRMDDAWGGFNRSALF